MIKTILITLLLVTSFALLKEPEFIETRNVRLRSLGMQTSTISADLMYFNPNNIRLDMKNVELEVYLDNNFLGKSRIDSLIQIPKRDTFAIPMVLEVNMKQVFANAFSILSKDEIELRVNGQAKMGKSGIFINVPVRYKGKHKLSELKSR